MNTPGSRLKQVINKLSITEETVAQLLDRNVSTVYRWYTLDTFPRTIQIKIRELKDTYKNINLDWIETGLGEMFVNEPAGQHPGADGELLSESALALLDENKKLKQKQELLDDVMLKQAKLIFELQEEIMDLKKRLKKFEQS